MDFSHAPDSQAIAEMAEKAILLVRSSRQKGSVRGLIDFTGTSLNGVVRRSMQKMSLSNGPYMRAVAFVGFGVLLSLLFRFMLKATGRSNHRVFRTRQEALDWLEKQ